MNLVLDVTKIKLLQIAFLRVTCLKRGTPTSKNLILKRCDSYCMVSSSEENKIDVDDENKA